MFPDRQILIRDHGKIRCFSLTTFHQLLMVGVIAGCALWALLATAAYFDGVAVLASKDDEIAQRSAELDGVRANYKAAFNRLDEFQTVFSGITCEISDIQDSLLKLTERNVASGKRGTAAPPMPRLDPDASGCRGRTGDPASLAATTPSDISAKASAGTDQEKLRLRVAHLEEELARLKASHGAFLEQTAGIAAIRINELERALTAVGVDSKALGEVDRRKRKSDDERPTGSYGRGGPFIAARNGARDLPPDGFNPVALFNTHADRLDNLTAAIKTLPLGEPLADYEVTSPFGARNDPLNGLTGIHEGVDMGAPAGTPVLATGEGQVVYAAWRDRYGMAVEIEHGLGLRTRYAHLAKVLVTVGQQVSRGTPVGLVGATGRTTGPHLHYEVRMSDQPTNPMKFISAGQNVLKGQ